MSFKDQLKDDAANTFLNTDEFAESITYTPKSGAAKIIKAIVNRKRLTPASEDSGRVLLDQVDIIIANDSTYGVASVNKGQDEVSLPENLGGTSIGWIVADIIGQDEGTWHLLLQK